MSEPQKKYSGEMLVIGAGFGRTGTSSLKKALEILLEAPCYHMSEVGANGHTAFWEAVGNGENVNYRDVFNGYAATLDFPACTFWEDIHQQYPDAKILLSVREPHSWFKSCRETIFTFIQPSGYMRFGQWVCAVLIPRSRGFQR